MREVSLAIERAVSGCLESVDDFKQCQDVLLSVEGLVRKHGKQSPPDVTKGVHGLLQSYCRVVRSSDRGSEATEQSFEPLLLDFLHKAGEANMLATSKEGLSCVLNYLCSLLEASSNDTELSPAAQSSVIQVATALATSNPTLVESNSLSRLTNTILHLSPTSGPLKFGELDRATATAASLEKLSQACASQFPADLQEDFLRWSILATHAVASSCAASDTWHLKRCTSFLSCTSNLVQLRSQHTCLHNNSAALVDSLRVFWSVGLDSHSRGSASTPAYASSSSCSTAKATSIAEAATAKAAGKYVPPWQRKQSARSTRHTSTTTADSSQSDSDTSTTPSHPANSRIRALALQTLTAAIKSHPAALHQVWDRLLPHSPPSEWGNAPSRLRTLPEVLLLDPSATVRVAAATAMQALLTGPKNTAFVRVARSTRRAAHTARSARPRAFMPLSESMAGMLSSTHAGLAVAVRQEMAQEVLADTLKVAALLMRHTPYQNMQEDTVSELLEALAVCWEQADALKAGQQQASSSHSSPRSPRQEGVATRCAVLAAFSAALQSPAAGSVTSLLLSPPLLPTVAPDTSSQSSQGGLPWQAVADRWDVKASSTCDVDIPSSAATATAATAAKQPISTVLFSCASPSCTHPAMQWEACSALRTLCSAAHAVECLPWANVKELVNAHVKKVLEAATRSNVFNSRGRGGSARADSLSASMPEKVANQALRLAGDWVCAAFSACAAATHATTARDSEEAGDRAVDVPQGLERASGEFINLVMHCAAQAGVPVLRSASFAAAAAAPPSLWRTLPHDCVLRFCERVLHAATSDGVPATRMQAVYALQGLVADASCVVKLATAALESTCEGRSTSEGVGGVANALGKAAVDSAVSVRTAAAGALAVFCTTLKSLVHGPGEEQPAGDAAGAARVVSATSRSHAEHVQPYEQCPVSGLLPISSWLVLSEGVLGITRGGEKVRPNGIRAICSLFAVLPVAGSSIHPNVLRTSPSLPDVCVALQQAPEKDGDVMDWHHFCAQAVDALVDGLQSGSPKVAWNACIAASQVFSRRKQFSSLVNADDLRKLHACVVEQLHASHNFKVRIHAAHALQVAGPSTEAGGGTNTRVLAAVVHGLRTLRESDGGHLEEQAASAASALNIPEHSTAFVARGRDSSERGEGAESFRYHAELLLRLTAVLVDFVAAVAPAETHSLQPYVPWMLEFLDEQLASWSVASASSEPFGSATSTSGTVAPTDTAEQVSSLNAQERTDSQGNIDEVAVRGGRRHLHVPPSCSNVAAAISNLSRLVEGGQLAATQQEALLQRMQSDIEAHLGFT